MNKEGEVGIRMVGGWQAHGFWDFKVGMGIGGNSLWWHGSDSKTCSHGDNKLPLEL
jgi:hypothetical protein